MAHKWWRLHATILTSRKIQTLPDKLVRPWLNSMAIACEHDGVLPEIEDYAFEMRLPLETAKKFRSELIERKLIDEHDGVFTMHDWEFWQFENGTSEKQRTSAAERAKRYRDRRDGKRDASVTSRDESSVTSRDDKRDERDENVTRHGSDENVTDDFADTIERIASRHPKKSGIAAGRTRLAQVLANSVDPIAAVHSADTIHAAFCASDEWKRDGGRFAPKLSNWADQNGFLDPPPATQQEDEVW